LRGESWVREDGGRNQDQDAKYLKSRLKKGKRPDWGLYNGLVVTGAGELKLVKKEKSGERKYSGKLKKRLIEWKNQKGGTEFEEQIRLPPKEKKRGTPEELQEDLVGKAAEKAPKFTPRNKSRGTRPIRGNLFPCKEKGEEWRKGRKESRRQRTLRKAKRVGEKKASSSARGEKKKKGITSKRGGINNTTELGTVQSKE